MTKDWVDGEYDTVGAVGLANCGGICEYGKEQLGWAGPSR